MSIVTEILNPFFNVRNKVKDGGTWVDVEKRKETQHMRTWLSRDISPGDSFTVFQTWGKKVILESFDFGANTVSVHPLLWVNESDSGDNQIYNGNLFHVPILGSGRHTATATSVSSHGSEFLEVVNSDDTGVKVILKRPIVLPNGCHLAFRIVGDTPGKVTYKAMWREIEGE